MSAIEFLDAEAQRAVAAHEMARLHQRFDLVLCPTVPARSAAGRCGDHDPVQALWTQWAPWTFTFNMTRQPAITMPLGPARRRPAERSATGRRAQYRDDLVLRAARAMELAVPIPVAAID